MSERLALPSNLEVKEALEQYQSLYGGRHHGENLLDLLRCAVRVMHRLTAFSPRLVGSVLDGTASSHSRVALHVFADSTEQIVLFFIENGMPFNEEQRQIRWHDGTHRFIPLIVFEYESHTVELSLFQTVDMRQAPPSPIDGKPQRRATPAEVQALLDDSFELSDGLVYQPA